MNLFAAILVALGVFVSNPPPQCTLPDGYATQRWIVGPMYLIELTVPAAATSNEIASVELNCALAESQSGVTGIMYIRVEIVPGVSYMGSFLIITPPPLIPGKASLGP